MKCKFKRILKISSIVILLISLFAILTSCLIQSEEEKIEQSFNEKLEEKLIIGEEKIYLEDLTDFKWDRACFFEVSNEYYSDYPMLSQILGKDFQVSNIKEACDSFKSNALIFYSKDSAHLINLSQCIDRNLCRTEKHRSSLYCCSKNSYIEKKELIFDDGRKSHIYSLNEDNKENEK